MQKVRGKALPEGHSPPTVRKHAVSGTFHSPHRGTFHHFRSRYWFAIGRQGVFSLAGWSPRIQSGFHVSGLTRVSSKRALPFAYRAITFFGRAFQNVRLDNAFVTLRAVRNRPWRIPLPCRRNASGLARRQFRLIPVRSPLLGESMSLSLPGGTEMFQFPPFATAAYGFSGSCEGMTPRRLPDSEIPGSLPA